MVKSKGNQAAKKKLKWETLHIAGEMLLKSKLLKLHADKLLALKTDGLIESFVIPHQLIADYELDPYGRLVPVIASQNTNSKKNKLNSSKCYINGIKFDSIAESKFYLFLKEKLRAGDIQSFSLQPEYELIQSYKRTHDGKDINPLKYRSDFLIQKNDGEVIIVDTKGYETPEFKIKRKLYDFLHEHFPQDFPRLVVIKIRERVTGDTWFNMDSNEEIR